MPYKTFANNQLLTAAEVNDYLMRQAIIRVADASARDAIPAPVVGMMIYREDTRMIERRTAAGWVPDATPWIEAALTANWGTYASEKAWYRRQNGWVTMMGRVTGSAAAGTIIFTLPAGFRHDAPYDLILNTHSDNGATIVAVKANGEVTIVSRTGQLRQGVSLAGISFPVAI